MMGHKEPMGLQVLKVQQAHKVTPDHKVHKVQQVTQEHRVIQVLKEI